MVLAYNPPRGAVDRATTENSREKEMVQTTAPVDSTRIRIIYVGTVKGAPGHLCSTKSKDTSAY